jgi:hypothetical protein
MKSFEELMSLSPSSPYAAYTYYCDNLGDHIQTLALLQHFRPQTLLKRDRLTPHPDLALVSNGWLTSGRFAQPSEFRGIKHVGIHLAPHVRTPEMLETLKPCGIIGCRDTITQKFLSENGIPTHLTRCATLTFPTYHGKREGIYSVDLQPEIHEKVASLYPEAVCLSHDLKPFAPEEVTDEDIVEQYRKAYGLLMRYRTAELVITTRVHATLPCIAFGTPVIYVGVLNEEDDRVSIFDGIGVKIATKEIQQDAAQALEKPPVVNSDPFRNGYLAFLENCLQELKS